MPIPLREVLADPSLAAGAPLLLAGESALSGPVRWVHTSEVIEIADLLRGGELLLVGGVALATATAAERRDYIRTLMARRVAGLAIETGRMLPAIPQEMIEEAERVGLALIELRKVVPFVDVTEAVNGLLVTESVRRLQEADKVSHVLAEALSGGAGPEELVEIIAGATDADVELVSLTGELIANVASPAERTSSTLVSAPITTAGVTVATLVLYPHPTSDQSMLEAARDRAPEPIGLALLRSLRSGPLSRLERDARELFMIARKGLGADQRFADLADRLGLSADGPHLGVVAQLGDHQLKISGIDQALRRRGRRVVSYVYEQTYLAVVALGGGSRRVRRTEVLADLSMAKLPLDVRVAVGPGSRTLTGLGRSLAEAEVCFTLARHKPTNGVLDAADVGIERLLLVLDRSEFIADFIDEQLGELFDLDARKGGVMIDTLSSYLLHWGSKIDTATALHMHRQSLYQRMTKIFEALGDVRPGSAQLGSLMVAVQLEAARRRAGQG